MLNLLIMAAGMGSRYGGIKQIDPIGPNGEIIIDYSIYDAKLAGINKFVFVIRKELEADFKNLLDSKYKGKLNYEFAFQEFSTGLELANLKFIATRKKPWGTGHAILCAKDALKDEPFIVINADDYYGKNAFKILSSYILEQKDENFSMLSYKLGNTLSKNGTVSRGVCELDSKTGFLKNISELKKIKMFKQNIVAEDDPAYKLNENTPVSMNFWGFNKNIFKILKSVFNESLANAKNINEFEYYIPLLIKHCIDNKIIETKVVEGDETWFGITYKEDKPSVLKEVSNLIQNKIYPERIY